MKPRHVPLRGPGTAEVLAGTGCRGWALRPRPRLGTVMSAKSSGSHATAAASAVHSNHHVHATARFRSVGLWYHSDLEARVEKAIYACRFMTFLAIAGSLLGSVLCFFKGCVYVMDAFIEYYFHGGGKVTLMLVEAIDMYLIGTVMFVFGTGLYEIFISNMDIAKTSSNGSNLFGLFRLPERPKWLEIQSVNDLKTKLGHVIVMVLLVGIVEKSKRVTISSSADLFCFAASVLLSSGGLYLLSRLNNTKGARHA